MARRGGIGGKGVVGVGGCGVSNNHRLMDAAVVPLAAGTLKPPRVFPQKKKKIEKMLQPQRRKSLKKFQNNHHPFQFESKKKKKKKSVGGNPFSCKGGALLFGGKEKMAFQIAKNRKGVCWNNPWKIVFPSLIPNR